MAMQRFQRMLTDRSLLPVTAAIASTVQRKGQMHMIKAIAATLVGAGIGFATGQKRLAAGLSVMAIFFMPAALSEFQTGDFWIGESLVAGFGLILGAIIICSAAWSQR
ncbi:MAG: hypothetical protein KF730_16540 [Sphingomonas sp.]|uniref:hypothetical protein n=1 Tax=Sphingomonas sp. TaxID=28214 RepID=UPI0025DE1581|nr:hypothetical protein [Sphingomonas sp.]MBX3566169.1 hypothetical protein [Sphingomonas sp.]